MVNISKLQARELIRTSGGKIFTARNIKKDGTERALNGRLNVTKGVKGVGMRYNPDDYNLITVFDMKKQEFRTLNLETVYQIDFQHERYEVND